MKYVALNEEVLYTSEVITRVDWADIEFLKAQAVKNRRRRIRLCAHPDVGDRVHEMIIVHVRDAYIRPHKHLGKSESFHIIEGRLQVVLFDDRGMLRDVVSMAPPGTGETFFYRLSESCFHTVVPLSDLVVYHETTNGPFTATETIFAPWAPAEDDDHGKWFYLDTLKAAVHACRLAEQR